MTSREVLDICKKIYINKNESLASAKKGRDMWCDEDSEIKAIWDDDVDYFQSEVDLYERIIQDLEVLEIIKANKNIIFSKKPNYENMNADDFFKLSKWLDKED